MVTLERQNVWQGIKGSLLPSKLIFRLVTTVLKHTDYKSVPLSAVFWAWVMELSLLLSHLSWCACVCAHIHTPGRVVGWVFLTERQDLLSLHSFPPLLLGGLKEFSVGEFSEHVTDVSSLRGYIGAAGCCAQKC